MEKIIQKTKNRPDWILFGLLGFLIIWGLVMVSVTSFPLSLQNSDSPWQYFFQQSFRLLAGLVLAIIFYLLPLAKLKKIAPVLFFINLVFLFLVFLPKIGYSAGGATRWLKMPGFLVQPSEFLKLFFIIYLSAWLAGREKQSQKNSLKTFLPFVGILAILGFVLIKQPDLSTLFIIGATGAVIYFCSKMPFWHNIVVLIFGSGALALFAKNASYRLDRLLTFLHPERDPLGKAYQLRQSLIAVGSGKLSGFNDGPSLGLSRQKFGFLPNPMTDSIFSIVGEELGFLGASLLVACFLFLAFWAVFLANKIDDSFGRLAILGIITWFSLQAFFNIGGNLGVLPLGGVPLPFFSFGGSHLIAELAACGLLLNISKYKK